MPLTPDPFQRIVNVHWQSGLAVIFGPQAQDAPKQEIPDELSGNRRDDAA
jgi:hypothetical protein